MPTPPVSEVLDHLRCPRCRKAFYGLWSSVDLRADFGCQRKDCPQKWWAMYLSPGTVEPQLASAFGEELAAELMRLYGLPRRLDAAMFWHVALSGHQVHHRRNEREHGWPPAA